MRYEDDLSFSDRVYEATGFAPWEIPVVEIDESGFGPALWGGAGTIIAKRTTPQGEQEVVFARPNTWENEWLYVRTLEPLEPLKEQAGRLGRTRSRRSR
jgi:hypothetical protein